MASSVDPRKIYSALYAAQQPQTVNQQQQQPDLNLGLGGFDLPQNWGSSSTTSTTNPEAPNAPAPTSGALSSWQNFLKALGAGSGEHLDAGSGKKEGANWSWLGDLMFRNNQRGFDLFGLAPQEIYWQNLKGSGATVFDVYGPQGRPDGNNIVLNPDYFWRSLQNPGNWGEHDDPGAPGEARDWLKQDLDQLQKVWGQLSATDRQAFRDRLLNGMGLPEYLKAFLSARPQWITDYISNTFKV